MGGSRSWFVVLGAAVVLAAPAVAEEATFIGAAKCKMCHKVQHASWAELGHASSFDRLEEKDRANPECLSCHATGASADLPGVQCEACHGPGSGYKSMKTMKDPAAAAAAGLLQPGEAECRTCHEAAPHEVTPFDYATAKETGIHEFKNPG